MLWRLAARVRAFFLGKPAPRQRSPKWPALRRKFLEGKTCAACGSGRFLQAHHVRPFHLRPDLELCEGNLLCLCEGGGRNCHFYVGHLCSWASWNGSAREDAAAWLSKVRARP